MNSTNLTNVSGITDLQLRTTCQLLMHVCVLEDCVSHVVGCLKDVLAYRTYLL
jgi:hypothetical protein